MAILAPYHLVSLGGRQLVHWLNAEKLDLHPGFFRDAIKLLPSSHRPAVVTPLSDLVSGVHAAAQPAGLIFHTSRCGSTLLCQMLKQHPSLLVLGEPALLSQLVTNPTLSRSQKILALQQAVGFYVRWAQQGGHQLVIKLSSWNLLHWELYSEAFSCPALCVYRRPLPVLESLLRKPPSWLGADRVGSQVSLDSDATKYGQQDDTLQRAGQCYLKFAGAMVALLFHRPDVRVVEYETILNAGAELLEFFGQCASDSVLRDMSESTRIDSKAGGIFSYQQHSDDIDGLEMMLAQHHPQLAQELVAAHAAVRAHSQQLVRAAPG